MAVLTRLLLRDFRNIERGDIVFPADGIVVIGDNGQGKTNLLEAIYYFQLLRSARGVRDTDLVRFDAPAFHLTAHIATDGPHTVTAAFERAGKRKKSTVDGAQPRKLSEALGTLPAVMVSPRDVELISGAPTERRRFLDVVLALTSRRYLAALQSYRAALVRRNSALRETARTGRGLDAVAVWEPALAQHGAVLVAERMAWVETNAEEFTRICARIGERATVTMQYTTNAGTAANAYDTLLRALEHDRHRDIKRGVTHAGPHRDELPILLGGRELRTFGSGGQQRTAAIALRMLEAATLRAHRGSPPLLLLDDPFAELDARRAGRILALLRDAGRGQTILVVPRASDIPPTLTTLERWTIDSGVIRPIGGEAAVEAAVEAAASVGDEIAPAAHSSRELPA